MESSKDEIEQLEISSMESSQNSQSIDLVTQEIESNDSSDKPSDSKALERNEGVNSTSGGMVRSESSKSVSSLNDMSSTEDAARHELRKLSLDQNGTFMVDFDPEKSQREMRKMNRRIYIKESKRNQLYDDRGILLESSTDLCDCLDKICPGCHFPCPRCGSSKCGVDCRCNPTLLPVSGVARGSGV